ncbi:cytochrome P450 CYP684A2 [Stachybotrys elegans]|uniref:Cytochrome P450 CYP684A2 n=1 Tax=Stachybotrys elegans TaxID=80388 RepID=A0A8K0SR91_9HYPO|nr:cytochrome P450 CYP684A2 [Stachybotrys elegans]
MSPTEVDISDLAAFKEIYTVKETFRKSSWYDLIGIPGDQNVFITRNSDIHRRHRKLLSGPMAESSLKHLTPLVDDKVTTAIQRMREEADARGTADVFKWFIFMATDVIAQLTFGDSFHMLEKGKKNDYSELLESLAGYGALRVTFPTITAWASVLPIPLFTKAVALRNELKQYAIDALKMHKRFALTDPTSVERSLLAAVIRAKDEADISFDELRSNAQIYIVAGSDTTATTLTFLVWAVCKNPQIRDELVKELRGLPPDFEEADLRGLSVLDNVIHEALRLFPAVPTIMRREVPAGGATLAGYFFEAGTIVGAQPYTMHRDPYIFPDPEEFKPSRWNEPTKAMNDALFTFGRGSRVCLGKNLAWIELRLATSRFFLEFPDARVSPKEDMSDADMAMKTFFLLQPEGHRCLIEAP